MRVFISSDIEGTCGITSWSETQHGNPDYPLFQRQMTKEVAAAAQGAVDFGAQRIVIRDAHETARNLIPDMLPEEAFLARGWRGDIHSMMSGIQLEKFDAAIFTGYHSAASSAGSPLAHTTSREIEWIELNGERMSEFLLNAHTAAYYKVPVVMITGDAAICRYAKSILPNIVTVEAYEGIGNGTLSPHPAVIERKIKKAATDALAGDIESCLLKMPASFEIKVRYFEHAAAKRSSFYPGVTQTNDKTVVFECTDYIEILRFYQFCI